MVHLPLVLSPALPHGNQPNDDGHAGNAQEDDFHRREIIRGQRNRVRQDHQVLRVKRRHPHRQEVSVGKAPDQPDDTDQESDENPPPDKVDHGKRHANQKGII